MRQMVRLLYRGFTFTKPRGKIFAIRFVSLINALRSHLAVDGLVVALIVQISDIIEVTHCQKAEIMQPSPTSMIGVLKF